MNNRQILRYALDGIYNQIKRLEKEVRIINGAIYQIDNNLVVKGRYRGYTYISSTKTKKELTEGLKELKKEYNELVYDIKQKNIYIVYRGLEDIEQV